MRKIEDLKENECIEIRTKKEARLISKKLRKRGIIGCLSKSKATEESILPYHPNYLHFVDKLFSNSDSPLEKIYRASDFMKKNSLKYRIKSLEVKVDTLVAKECVVTEPDVVKNHKLKVGRWYKLKDRYYNFLMCYSGNGLGYGFNSFMEWGDNYIMDLKWNWQPATNEEVESALIEESKKRGFKKGVKWINTRFTVKEEYSNIGDLVYDPIDDLVYLDNNTIFYNGKWATIIDQPKEIDWSKPGIYVKAKDGRAIFFVIKSNIEKGCFEGVCLIGDSITKKGEYSNDFGYLNEFEILQIPITLCNEE